MVVLGTLLIRAQTAASFQERKAYDYQWWRNDVSISSKKVLLQTACIYKKRQYAVRTG
jgi:hypothetical protein